MKLLQWSLLLAVGLWCSSVSARQYQLLPQPYYLNNINNQLSYLNPGQVPYAPGYAHTMYLPSSFYSPSLHRSWPYYQPGQLLQSSIHPAIHSTVHLNPEQQVEGSEEPEPTQLTKSHVQFRIEDPVVPNLPSVPSLPSLPSLLTSPSLLPHHYAITRSLCLSCSCESDYGCSYNCDKCSAHCLTCSCQESIGCRYNCDKCQSDSRDADTTETATETDAEAVETEPTATESESTEEEEANVTEAGDNASGNDVTTEAPATAEAAGDVDADADGADAAGGAITDTDTDGADADKADGGDADVVESEDEDEEEIGSGLANPTFPLTPLTAVPSNQGDNGESGAEAGSNGDAETGTGTGSETGLETGSTDQPGTEAAPICPEVDLCLWGPSCERVVNEVYPLCNYDCNSCQADQDGGCKSSSGSAVGEACIFPFIYKGVRYTGCAPLHSESRGLDFWCSTKTDVNGYHVTGPFDDPGKYVGYCDSTCPRDIDGFKL